MEKVTLNVDKENNGQKKEEEIAKKKVILDLLEQLKQVRKDSRNLAIKTFAIKGVREIEEQVTQMKDSFMEKAKMYGKKAETVAQQYIDNKEDKNNVIQQYRTALEEIQREYEDAVNYAIAKKKELEEVEDASFNKEMDLQEVRKQIKESPEYAEHMKEEEMCLCELEKMLEQKVEEKTYKAKKEEYAILKEKNPLEKCTREIKEEKERREKIQDVIEMCDNTLDKCKKERKRCIHEKKEDKKNQLSVIKNQNFVQKIMGGIINKFKSAKKVVNNLIEGVQEVNYHLNDEVLVAFRENMSNGIDKVLEEISEKGRPLIEKGRPLVEKGWDQTKEKGAQFMENRKEDWENIKEKGRPLVEKGWDQTKEKGAQFMENRREDWNKIKGEKEQMLQRMEAALTETIENGKKRNTEHSLAYAKMKENKTEQPSRAYDESVYHAMTEDRER